MVKNKTSNLSLLLREGCAILWGEKVRYNRMPHFLDAAWLRFFTFLGAEPAGTRFMCRVPKASWKRFLEQKTLTRLQVSFQAELCLVLNIN